MFSRGATITFDESSVKSAATVFHQHVALLIIKKLKSSKIKEVPSQAISVSNLRPVDAGDGYIKSQ